VTDLTPERVRETLQCAQPIPPRVRDEPWHVHSEEIVCDREEVRNLCNGWLAQHAELDRLRAELSAACTLLREACDESAGRFVGPAEAFLARQEKPT
jgi:hypothetical protein